MQFTKKETATILAALRLWQSAHDSELAPFAPYFVGVGRLTDDEMDALCERLNFSKEDREKGTGEPPLLAKCALALALLFVLPAPGHCASAGSVPATRHIEPHSVAQLQIAPVTVWACLWPLARMALAF